MWVELKTQVEAWSKIIDDAHEKMEKLASAVAECQLALSNMESKMELIKPVEEVFSFIKLQNYLNFLAQKFFFSNSFYNSKGMLEFKIGIISFLVTLGGTDECS